MKILYVITLPNIGGAQAHVLELINYFKTQHTVHLIVGSYGWLTDRLDELGVEYVIETALVREINVVKDIKSIYSTVKYIKSFKPDIVHCHSSKAGIIGRIAGNIARVPVIFTAHGWVFTEGVSPKKRVLFAYIERAMFQFTNKVICVSDYDYQLARKVFNYDGKKLLTIHNAIRDVKSVKKEYVTNDSIIMVARFDKPKDQLLLVRAVENINKKGILINCMLVGDGPNLETIKKYINNKMLNDVITLTGSRTDIEKLLLENDIFCLISNYEGLPISIIEAMRAGLPVIASDVGGVHELVENDFNGYLVEKGNLSDLEEKMMSCYKNKTKMQKMGINSREKYRREFSFEQMIDQLQSVYKELVIADMPIN